MRAKRSIPPGATLRKPSKTYPRMPKHALPEPLPLTTPLEEVLLARTSRKDMSLASPMSLQELSTLLGHSLRAKEPHGKRRHPSGGGLFPVETYLLAHTITGLPRAAYHYDPDAHALDELWPIPENLTIGGLMRGGEWATFSAGILAFSCVWNRTTEKYGDFAYAISHLETGHMGQNVVLAAAALGVNACPFAGFDDTGMARLFDVQQGEQVLYSIAFGKPAA